MNWLFRRRNLMRVRHGHDHARVTFVELFFDLVFVFAVTQLSHSLVEDMTPVGALHTVILLMAVWWVWVYTSWATNWLDPERVPVRLLLFLVMLIGLVMSASIPEAFGERGLPFAIAIALIQVGRTAFVAQSAGDDRRLVRNFQRVTAWLAFSSVFWLAGGFFGGDARLALWLWRWRSTMARRSWPCGCPASADPRSATGTSKAATWPSAAGCSSSSRSANRSW